MGFSDPNFWQNFWPNFWSNLIVGVVITAIIGWFYQRMHSLKLQMACRLINQPSNQSNTGVSFSIHNIGGRALNGKDAYYTLLVNSRLQPGILRQGTEYLPYTENIMVKGKPYIKWEALVTGPTFPQMRTNVLELQVNTNSFEAMDFLYWISTVDGYFPKLPFFIRPFLKKDKVTPGKPIWYTE